MEPVAYVRKEKRTMTPMERKLLDAILASPEDDAPRLIYADWLDEQGESDRAEF